MRSQNIELVKGDDQTLHLTVTDENGDPFSISGYTIRFLIKRNLLDSDADAIVEKNTSSGITITDGPNGLADVEVSAADTLLLDRDRMPYAVKIKSGASKTRTVVKGEAAVVEVAVRAV